jgi:hypothetical protein
VKSGKGMDADPSAIDCSDNGVIASQLAASYTSMGTEIFPFVDSRKSRIKK